MTVSRISLWLEVLDSFRHTSFMSHHVAGFIIALSPTINQCYYTSDSLWKIWLVQSIQSIHDNLWTWHDKCNICCCCRYIAFIMSSSTSAWLLSSLECSPQKQNGWTLRFCFWGWIMWKMCNKTIIIIEFGFRMISWIIKTLCLCYLPQPSALADNTELSFDNSWYHAQPHPIIVYCK